MYEYYGYASFKKESHNSNDRLASKGHPEGGNDPKIETEVGYLLRYNSDMVSI